MRGKHVRAPLGKQIIGASPTRLANLLKASTKPGVTHHPPSLLFTYGMYVRCDFVFGWELEEDGTHPAQPAHHGGMGGKPVWPPFVVVRN